MSSVEQLKEHLTEWESSAYLEFDRVKGSINPRVAAYMKPRAFTSAMEKGMKEFELAFAFLTACEADLPESESPNEYQEIKWDTSTKDIDCEVT